MNRKAFSNVEDAVEYLNSKEINEDIIVIPPEVDELTDEEEVDYDKLDVAIMKGLAGEVEVIIPDVYCDEIIVPSTSLQKAKKVKTEKKSVPVWKTTIPSYTKWSNMGDNHKKCFMALASDLGNASPVDIFEKLFSDEVYDLIVEETTRYAKNVKNDQDFEITAEDIKIFIGFLIFSGYHTLPSERDYWSGDEDLGINLVQNAFTRNAYLKIKSYIHFQDNSTASENKHDRSFKIRPLVNKVNEAFSQWGIFSQCLSIDSMVVKYLGHNALKRFRRGKSIGFGYKVWAMCGENGYCFKFALYCGKEQSENHDLSSLAERVVMDMLSIFEDPSSHIIFMDDFFTSHALLHKLQRKGFRASGGIRDSRTENCTIISTAALDKMTVGTYDFRFDEKNEIAVVKWRDSKSVAVGTNFDNIVCTSKVHRWSSDKKLKITIPQPSVISSYNKFIGGVHHHDWLLEKHSIAITGRKWYWCLLTRIIDMVLVNASIIYRTMHGSSSMSMKDFRRAIAVKYLKLGIGKEVLKGRPFSLPTTSKSGVSDDIRYDRVDHSIGKRPKQRRCQFEGCSSRPLTYCVKCNITLCLKCFPKFHTKP